MKTVFIIHLGIGQVGKRVKELIEETSDHRLKYHAAFTSKSPVVSSYWTPWEALKDIGLPFILIDTTASDATLPFLIAALKKGGYVVLSNKKPITGTQQDFDSLMKLAGDRVYFETTVGAGLPIISTLKTLLSTRDTIISIQGCLSGTLGFICDEMDKGTFYSDAVMLAKEQGLTEPDPRDDLSGMDVARKALILGRMVGLTLELKDIQRTSFYQERLASCSVEEFLRRAGEVNKEYGDRFAAAKKKKSTLRYVASIRPTGISVGLMEVPLSSPMGRLVGPDNLIQFETRRYRKHPLVIQGPGAGIDVTAAGVMGDIVHILQNIGCGE